jgi:hypothetical protein
MLRPQHHHSSVAHVPDGQMGVCLDRHRPGDGTGVGMTAQGVGGLEWGLVGTVGPRGKLRMGRQFMKRQPFARAIQLHYRFSLSL